MISTQGPDTGRLSLRRWLLALSLCLSACAPPPAPPTASLSPPVLARAHVRTADGVILPVRAWWPAQGAPRAIVVALHGFNDYGRAFQEPGRYLAAQGLAVLAYDQRGFGNAPGRGLWAGAAAYAADLTLIVEQLQRQHPGVPVFILGESMGGAVAIAALTAPSPPPVAGLILSAPAVWSRALMPWYQRAILALAAATLPELEVTGSGLRIQASDNIAMLRGLGRDPLVIKATRVAAIDGLTSLMDTAQANAGRLNLPVLVLYGAHDQVIPEPPITALLQQLAARPAVRLARYPDGYHLLLRDLKAQRPLADIAAWISDPSAPLPSGYEHPLPKPRAAPDALPAPAP